MTRRLWIWKWEKEIMKPADFDIDGGINEPYISGYDILLDRIMDDMIANPKDYKPWEISLLGEVPQDSYKDYWKDIRAFIDDWCEARSESVYF